MHPKTRSNIRKWVKLGTLARCAGISQTQLSRILSGSSSTTPERARVLSILVHKLSGGNCTVSPEAFIGKRKGQELEDS